MVRRAYGDQADQPHAWDYIDADSRVSSLNMKVSFFKFFSRVVRAAPADDVKAQRSVIARTATGTGWILGWRFATRFIGLGSTLVLVRLLTPGDFGMVSLAAGLIQGLDAVAGFGTEGAIIRIATPGRDIYDAGFTINVVRGVLTAFVMALAAIPIARFFSNPDLVLVIWVLAAGWAVNAFTNIGMVEYRRLLAFDMEFKIKIIPRLLALAITIPVAFVWHSYWALIAGIVFNQVITVVLSYLLHPYRPRFGVAGMRQIFGFSFWEWVIGLTGLVGGRADTIIIGRLLGTASVGVYGIGGEIASLPSTEIVAPLCRVLFSGFVEEERHGKDGSSTLLRVLALLAMITIPMNVGLSVMAYPIVKLCFGPEWLDAVPLIQLLGLAGSFSLFNAVGEALFSARGWLKTILWLVVVTTITRLVLLLLLIPRFGLFGGAMAAALISIMQEIIYVMTSLRRLNISLRQVLRSIMRPVLAVTFMAAVLAVTRLGWIDHDDGNAALWIDLFSGAALGAIVYVLSVIGLWLAAGRPNSAETDALAAARRLLAR
jgi:O-antigen/teichoic acid export membrane protein